MNDSLPKRIPDCAVNLLARREWFSDPSVLERVELSEASRFARLVSNPRINRSDVSAITLRRTIHFRKSHRFDPHTPRGLALLAHEAKHVEQYERDGLIRFNLKYILGFLRAGYGRAISYEAEAYELEGRVERHLRKEFSDNPGRHPCQELGPPHSPNHAFVKERPEPI